MVIGSYILIITLNVNGLNASNKRHRLTEWIQKQDPYYAVYKRPTKIQGHIQTESEIGRASCRERVSSPV